MKQSAMGPGYKRHFVKIPSAVPGSDRHVELLDPEDVELPAIRIVLPDAVKEVR
jgi:hypothetical protein